MILRSPFFQILVALVLGMLLGHFYPGIALQTAFLGDWFIAAVRFLVVPVVFFTVTAGIVAIGGARVAGRLGLKALVIFEVLSTLALVLGMVAAAALQPGTDFPGARAQGMQAVTPQAGIGVGAAPIAVPERSAFKSIASNNILRALMLALVTGTVLVIAGARGRRVAAWSRRAGEACVRIVGLLMMLAPVAAFSGIAFAVAKFGVVSLGPLARFVLALYLANIVFILVVLGPVAHLTGFRLLSFIRYLKEELLLVIGTSSSVTAMPGLIAKLEKAGCSTAVVGLAVPSGYSFNLTGSNIYITFAIVFLAQAFQVELNIWHLLSILGMAMITSKGASGVAGSAFIVLASTITIIPGIPDTALALIVGLERLLKCRPLTNIVGNGVACMAIAAWDRKLDAAALDQARLR